MKPAAAATPCRRGVQTATGKVCRRIVYTVCVRACVPRVREPRVRCARTDEYTRILLYMYIFVGCVSSVVCVRTYVCTRVRIYETRNDV